ncbi:MAG TPA: cadherin domain-containing protein [Candidatus Obscuribacterales bacterium]
MVYGKANDTAVNLSSLGSGGITLSSSIDNSQAGFALQGGQDINGDNIPDLIVGAPFGSAESAYGVFNLTSNGNQLSLGSNGFLLNNGGSETGYAVSMADLNGNGLADLIVSAPSSDTNQKGKVWVAFDPSAGTPIDLSTLADNSNNAGFVIQTDELVHKLFGFLIAPKTGRYVNGIGDFNGDGYADLAIGKAENAPYIVFGKTDGTAVNLDDLGASEASNTFLRLIPPATDLVLFGSTIQDVFAHTRMASVAGGGDVNGDGLADVLVSSTVDKQIYLVHGTSAPTSITLANVGSSTGGFSLLKPSFSSSSGLDTDGYDGTPGIQGQGTENNPRSAKVFSSSIVGDINGDGSDDLIVNFNGNTNTSADTLYVIFGRTETTTINLDDPLSPDVGFVIRGSVDSSETAIAFFEGRAAGDVNGDGLADIIIGAPFTNLNDATNDNTGKSYVLFGADFTGAISQKGDDGDNTLTGTSATDSLLGGRGNDTLQGAGGQDVLYGGAGNDVMSIADLQFQRIDGGVGEDTLALAGSDLSLDMATVRGLVRQIERIDLTGTGDNDLNIILRDLANLSDTSNRLVVIGDAGDSITSLNQDWVLASATPETVSGLDGLTFQRYSNGVVELWLDQRMTTILGTTLRDQTFTVDENIDNTTLVGQVQVSSLNGATVTNYQILSGNDTGAFAVDSSGNLRVADRTLLDFEATPVFTLTLQITDSEGFVDTGTVTVSLTDQNDTPTIQSMTAVSLAEHSAVGTVVGTAIASDQDAGDKLTYSLAAGNDNGIFAIDTTTGEITIANSARFNYESQTSYTLMVRATDLDGAFAETDFTINPENLDRLIYDRTLTFNANSVSQWGNSLDDIATVIETFTTMINDQVNAVMPAQLWGLSNQFALNSSVDLSGGDFSASLPIDVRVVLPDGITPGQTIVVRSGTKLRDTATLNASTPGANVELGLDLSIDYSASFDLPGSLGGSVPALFNGGTSGDYSISLPIPDRIELLNEPLLSVEGSLAFNAPVLTATTSQANLTTSSLSTQMKDEDWVDLSIEGDVSTFNLWETQLRSMGLPQGVQVNAGDSSLTFDVSDTLSSGEPVPSAGTIAGNPTVSWSEDDGWSVQYTVSNSPITTLNWTGDQWQGDFTANYSASKLNSLLGTPLSVIREAKTTYSYNLFNTDLDPRLGINQNLNLGLATMQGTLIFTELSEADPNRTATFTSGVVDGEWSSDRLSATLINVPLNADANGDGVVEVSTQVSPTFDFTNYTELTYGLDYAITAGDSSTQTTIKYSKTEFDLLKSLNPSLYWSLRLNADSFSLVREGLSYNGVLIVVKDAYYLATYDKGTIPPALSVTGNVDVTQPIVSGYQPNVGIQDAFTGGTQLENHLSYLVGEDDTALTKAFTLSSGGSTTGYSFSLTSQPSLGTVVNNNDGSFTFSLGSDFQFLTTGDYEDVSFSYTATNGTTTDSGTITVIVAGDDGQFNLYQDNGSVEFFLWDKTTLDLTAPTYVITHGWGDGGHTDDDFRSLAKGIQDYAASANILFTDWTDLSSNLNYSEAADDTLSVGQQLGNFLKDINLDSTTTTLIGHSLGAHVSGIAGDTYDGLTGLAIAQIIGLDPAGPLFESPGGRGTSERLDATDSDRVIAFHSSNTLGYDGTLADLDLYVNWGDLFQPGKSSFIGNHSYPIELLRDLYQGAGYLQPSNGSVFDIADLSTQSGSVNLDTTTAV